MKYLLLILLTIEIVITPNYLLANGQKRAIYVPADKGWMSASKMRKMLSQSGRLDGVVFYNTRNANEFTASARGTDGKHHIVNSFLVGYAPYKTDNIWIPLQVLTRKKVYEYDEINMGKGEMWQTSKQAHRIKKGDCEDHALALADWLITMGEDARVVLGKMEGEGHAWVVLLKDGRQYLLETTKKIEVKSGEKFPLTVDLPGYKPRFMFNRTLFWKNEGATSTSDYRSSHWKVKSVYTLGPTIR